MDALLKYSKFLFKTYKDDFIKYHQAIKRDVKMNKFPHNTEEVIQFIYKIKKSDRHLAFIIVLVSLSSNPKDYRISFLSAQLALNINYIKYAIDKLVKLENENSDDDHILAQVSALLARAYRDDFQLPLALSHFKKALEINIKLKNHLEEGWILYAIGKMYLNYLQQPSRSVDFLRKSLRKFELDKSLKSLRGQSACLDELGDVYRQAFKDYTKAIDIYKKAIHFNSTDSYNYQLGLSRNFAHLGQCYEMQNKLEKSEKYLKKSIEILRKNVGQHKGLGIRLTQLGNIQLKLKKNNDAIKNLREGQMYNYKNNRFVKYIILNDIYQGDYFLSSNKNNAISKYKQAIENARKTNYFDLAAFGLRKLSEVFFDMQLYVESKQAITESLLSNINNWENIQEGSPKLYEVSEKVELGEMYQSLFNSLINDYRFSFNTSIKVLDNVYEQLNLEQLRNTSKMIKYGNLMSGIKHEIQNLHNNIVSVLDDVLDEKELSEENYYLLQKLRGDVFSKSQVLSNSSISEIVSDIELKGISFNSIFQNQISNIRNDFRFQNIDIEVKAEIPVCRISINESSLKYIILNIFLNSAEAFGSMGTKETNLILVEANLLDKYLSIEITDNAGGINTEDFEKIYNFGFSTKTGGTGYGLASVKSLLSQFDGDIKIKSAEKKTIVKLRIPYYE